MLTVVWIISVSTLILPENVKNFAHSSKHLITLTKYHLSTWNKFFEGNSYIIEECNGQWRIVFILNGSFLISFFQAFDNYFKNYISFYVVCLKIIRITSCFRTCNYRFHVIWLNLNYLMNGHFVWVSLATCIIFRNAPIRPPFITHAL